MILGYPLAIVPVRTKPHLRFGGYELPSVRDSGFSGGAFPFWVATSGLGGSGALGVGGWVLCALAFAYFSVLALGCASGVSSFLSGSSVKTHTNTYMYFVCTAAF